MGEQMTVLAKDIEEAYQAMRNAKSYTSYKDRKKHYERLLMKARK